MQLLPNVRIPGFIGHQPERQFDNNTGTDKGHMQVWTRWHVRDFDYPGHRYSILSTIATAGCNLLTANIPARDAEEFAKFPEIDLEWWRRWYDWVDAHIGFINNTAPIPGTCEYLSMLQIVSSRSFVPQAIPYHL